MRHVLAAIVCASALFAGCATSRHAVSGQDAGSLETFMGKVRALSAVARPRPTAPFAVTIETWDPRLKVALAQLAAAPTAEHHRLVAEEYRRLGILDMAHSHLTAAIRLDPRDAAAFDGLARVWRDMGAAHLGLVDARRAVLLAPQSPVAANTLGTLLSAVGQPRDAQQWYSRALELDARASYALTNLCYTAVILADTGAVTACQRAAALAPESLAAHNNLALAYAAEGDFSGAEAEFRSIGGRAAADFNMGIVYLAKRQFQKAVHAFDAALAASPAFTEAAVRAQAARRQAQAIERGQTP